MYQQKHQHCTPLFTDPLRYMQWVERLPDGRLFTLMEVGKPDGPFSSAPCCQYLFGRISEDNGQTWGQPYLLYEWPERETTFCLQGWKSDRDGRIHVFASAISVYSFERNDFQGHIAYLRFDSYRGENPLYSDVPALYRYTGSLNNAIELDSGRIVFPLSTYQNGKFVSNTIWSDDHGQSWSASNDVILADEETHCESGAIEPVVAEVQPNVLVMLIRTVVNRIFYAVSYDGAATWSLAKPTAIPSSNAPATVQKLADGRFFIAWNDCLGLPMMSVRYSTARQCLYAAVTDDGFQTLRGVRVIAKKTIGEESKVMNTYPTTALDGDNILLKFFGVFEKNGSTWKSVQGYLASLDPKFLDETDVNDCWGDWICDLPVTQEGISLHPTDHEVAHAICNFPYAVKGSLKLTTRGELPANCRVLLSDCYLDRMNFYDDPETEHYEQYNRSLYTELKPDASGEWVLEWDETAVTLKVNGRSVQTAQKNCGGFNHCSIVFGPQGQLDVTAYNAHVQDPLWKTGIEY